MEWTLTGRVFLTPSERKFCVQGENRWRIRPNSAVSFGTFFGSKIREIVYIANSIELLETCQIFKQQLLYLETPMTASSVLNVDLLMEQMNCELDRYFFHAFFKFQTKTPKILAPSKVQNHIVSKLCDNGKLSIRGSMSIHSQVPTETGADDAECIPSKLSCKFTATQSFIAAVGKPVRPIDVMLLGSRGQWTSSDSVNTYRLSTESMVCPSFIIYHT
jgi:hypothetical protein